MNIRLDTVIKSLSVANAAIKNTASPCAKAGWYPTFSASGQDVWLPNYRFDQKGIVVSAVGARCGKAFKADGKWNVCANTHALSVNENIADRDYCWYLLNNEAWWIKGGSAQPFVKVKDSLKRKHNFPTLDEQKRIVHKLDQVAHLIELEQRELTLLDTLVKSRFVELFGDKQFPRASIGELVSSIPRAKSVFRGSDVIKYIDISSIDNVNNEITNFTEYTFSEAPSRAQQHLSKGDILISTVRPNLKNVAMVRWDSDNLVGSSGFCVLRVVKASPEYLMTVVCSNVFTEAMIRATTGANYPAIKDVDVLEYMVDLPPSSLQNEFSRFVKQSNKSKFYR